MKIAKIGKDPKTTPKAPLSLIPPKEGLYGALQRLWRAFS